MGPRCRRDQRNSVHSRPRFNIVGSRSLRWPGVLLRIFKGHIKGEPHFPHFRRRMRGSIQLLTQGASFSLSTSSKPRRFGLRFSVGSVFQHIVFESYLSVFAMPWDYISHGALPLTVLLLAQAEKVFLGRRTTVVINS